MSFIEKMDKDFEELKKEVIGMSDDEIYDLYIRELDKSDFLTDVRFFKRHRSVNRIFVINLMRLAKASLKQ